MAEAKNRRLPLLVTAAILSAFVALDYATPWIMHLYPGRDGEWLVAIAIGACIAQVTLIAAWAVFAPGNLVVRLPWSLLLGLMMWYVLSISHIRTVSWHYQEGAIAQLGINLLLGVSSLQLPLWIAKRAFRYRMLAPDEIAAPTATERFQFEIKHLLIGTLFLALALAPLRIVIPNTFLLHIAFEREMFFLIGASIVANLLATLPCLWGGFVSTHKLVPLGVGWLLYALLVTGLEVGALCAVVRYPPPELGRVFAIVYLVNVTQGAVVFGVMRCYRALGYRLLRAPRDMPPPESLRETWEKALVELEVDEAKPDGDGD
jgi:hypothetical protein